MIAIKSEDNEQIIAWITWLDMVAQGDIMELIKSFDSYKLKDGMFTLF